MKKKMALINCSIYLCRKKAPYQREGTDELINQDDPTNNRGKIKEYSTKRSETSYNAINKYK